MERQQTILKTVKGCRRNPAGHKVILIGIVWRFHEFKRTITRFCF